MWSLPEKKKNAFDSRWLSSMKVGDYDKLKQLVLVEAFKRSVSAEIRVHLDEHKVTDLKSAAVLSDDYTGCREQPPRGAPWVSGLVGHFVQTWLDKKCSHTVQFLDCRDLN